VQEVGRLGSRVEQWLSRLSPEFRFLLHPAEAAEGLLGVDVTRNDDLLFILVADYVTDAWQVEQHLTYLCDALLAAHRHSHHQTLWTEITQYEQVHQLSVIVSEIWIQFCTSRASLERFVSRDAILRAYPTITRKRVLTNWFTKLPDAHVTHKRHTFNKSALATDLATDLQIKTHKSVVGSRSEVGVVALSLSEYL